MSKGYKEIDIKEFREKGYLQEVNRQFFHPLGMALTVYVRNDNGKEGLSCIRDHREEGIEYGIYSKPHQEQIKFRERMVDVVGQMKEPESVPFWDKVTNTSNVMTIEYFNKAVEEGMFKESFGKGYYSTSEYLNRHAHVKMDGSHHPGAPFTHVVWFDK